MLEKLHQVGRLAYRVEGQQWNVYWALPNTMKDAIFIASIPLASVQKAERKHQFMGVVRDCVSDLFEQHWGVRPQWPEPEGRVAPEHERGGNV